MKKFKFQKWKENPRELFQGKPTKASRDWKAQFAYSPRSRIWTGVPRCGRHCTKTWLPFPFKAYTSTCWSALIKTCTKWNVPTFFSQGPNIMPEKECILKSWIWLQLLFLFQVLLFNLLYIYYNFDHTCITLYLTLFAIWNKHLHVSY